MVRGYVTLCTLGQALQGAEPVGEDPQGDGLACARGNQDRGRGGEGDKAHEMPLPMSFRLKPAISGPSLDLCQGRETRED